MTTGVPTVALPKSASLRLKPGDTFAERYVIEGLLGEGGMGAVYRVLDGELDEAVALKLLRPEWADAPGALDRFRREVKLARRVTHGNVARTFDLGSWESIRFLTMELIEGEALSKHVGSGKRVPLAEALRIAAEVSRGLAAAHTAGVVHRDLKPDNILLSNDRVVITDFGIARLAEGADAANATRTLGSAIGTPAYMAPEQVEGRELDGRADIYALGVVLYEMLTGELPFVGDTVYALAIARLSTPPPDPRVKVEGLPDGVATLVRAALGRRREERPDAQEMLRKLEELRGARVERVVEESHVRSPVSLVASAISIPTPSGPRTIAVVPQSGAVTKGALDLVQALSDALVPLRGVRVVPPSTARAAMRALDAAAEPATVGRALASDLMLEVSLRAASGRARVRVRLVEVATGTQLWSERFERGADEPFALEDDVVSGVTQALRLRLADEWGRRGPADPEARAAYRAARERYMVFGPAAVEDAIGMLRKANDEFPNDPWIMSALGAAMVRKWVFFGADSSAAIGQAEELTLRALAIDSSIGETYDTIGILRVQTGDYRAGVRAFHEALARSPLLAEAHEYLGRLLCECGHAEEGLRRLDLATRLEPKSLAGHWERTRTFALLGDRERAEAAFARCLELDDAGVAQIFQRTRLALWWQDSEAAGRILEALDRAELKMSTLQANLVPLLRSLIDGTPLSQTVESFRRLAEFAGASPRQRAFFRQISVEFHAVAGLHDVALEELTAASELPLIDVFWMDRCPVLAPLRSDARFARARALVAARAADVWS